MRLSVLRHDGCVKRGEGIERGVKEKKTASVTRSARTHPEQQPLQASRDVGAGPIFINAEAADPRSSFGKPSNKGAVVYTETTQYLF